MKDNILLWFATGEKGISSEAMACAVSGLPVEQKWANGNHPRDPSDLNRCLKFLAAVPEAKNHLDKVAALSETWAKLIDRWGEIEKCFIDEVGIDWCKNKGKKATKTYALMHLIIYPIKQKP